MKNFFKNLLILAIIIIFSFAPINSYCKDVPNLILKENSSNNSLAPHHFRTTLNTNLISNKSLNLSGLDNLNISGSGQFSENGLSLIQSSIKKDVPVTVIDLRQESHGFVNGIAVSWENTTNNSNVNLKTIDILDDENEKLNSLVINKPTTFNNTKNTVVVNNVQNENTLTNSKNINYVRIPVTDGKLPSEDMVNYFINIVKNSPENTWFHFHCKEGIGRTTTFMIMYDIMQNSNTISLKDIIDRQIFLSNMTPKSSASFYSGPRYEFLNSFYNKYKNDEYGLSCSAFNTNIEYDSYIKNTIIPKYLYVISENDMSKAEQTMISTLQGLISNKSSSQIYILSSNEPDYKLWLKDLKDSYNVKLKYVKDPWKLLNNFSSYIDGYILYSNFRLPSINNACSLASLKDSIAIDESLENKVKSYGITKLTYDCRNTDKYWAYKNLWNSGLNHSTVIELSPYQSIPLRDYAIMSKSLIFYENDINDTTLRESIFKNMDSTARCLGWGPDEHKNVSISSKFGVDMIAADWSYNLSVLSSYPTKQYSKFDTKNSLDNSDGYHYVTFIMSDGDNQQWLLGSNYSSKNWYGSNYRKDLPLGWSISPSIYYLAPTVFDKYYKDFNHQSFLVPPSGNGYMYPSKFPNDKLTKYTSSLNQYMEYTNQNYVLILDDKAFYNKDLWDKYTSNENIDGLLYLEYDKNNSYNGEILWSNKKPIVSCRDLLWEGLEDETQLINNITERVKLGYTDVKNPNSYTFVYVHVWSNTLDNVNDVIEKLRKNPSVKVVLPNEFMQLIKNNVSPKI